MTKFDQVWPCNSKFAISWKNTFKHCVDIFFSNGMTWQSDETVNIVDNSNTSINIIPWYAYWYRQFWIKAILNESKNKNCYIMIDNTLLLFGLFRGIDLKVNGLMNILLSEVLKWHLYSLFKSSLMLLSWILTRLGSSMLLPGSKWSMQRWSVVTSRVQCEVVFCRPVTTKKDLWLSWYMDMIRSL